MSYTFHVALSKEMKKGRSMGEGHKTEKSVSEPYEVISLLTVILLHLSKNHRVPGYVHFIVSMGSYFSDSLPQFRSISIWKC